MSQNDSVKIPAETMPWVTGTTRVFGTIAHPVDHVRAPMAFNPVFAARGLDKGDGAC